MLPKFKTNIFSSGEIFSIREQWISISGARCQKLNISFNFGKKFPFREQVLQIWEHESFYIFLYLSIYLSIYLFYIYIYNWVKKNSKIRLELSCYWCNHQVFKLFYLILKITKIHIKLTIMQKYSSATSFIVLSIHAIISF